LELPKAWSVTLYRQINARLGLDDWIIIQLRHYQGLLSQSEETEFIRINEIMIPEKRIILSKDNCEVS
jgi:hypothetical protein